MLRKVKRLAVIAILVLITVFLGSFSGCGDSADPLGTAIIQFYDVTTGTVITSTTIQPGSTLTLAVKVKNLRSDGTLAPVIGERVTFTLLNPGNGGGLIVVNDRTAGDGQAMAVYTSGNNFATDSVRATTGSGATATITITKTGGLIGARISSLDALPSKVASGQTTVVKAKVTDGNNNPMQDETVTFTLLVNESGGSFINNAGGSVSTLSVNTEASGNATIVYRVGADSAHLTVTDTIRASLSNGSSSAVIVTRTGPTEIKITLLAAPPSVSPGQTTIITATISSVPLGEIEELITFTIPVNNSGGHFIDASGNTSTVATVPVRFTGTYTINYKPGTTSAGTEVKDTVQGTLLNAESSAAIVTRTP